MTRRTQEELNAEADRLFSAYGWKGLSAQPMPHALRVTLDGLALREPDRLTQAMPYLGALHSRAVQWSLGWDVPSPADLVTAAMDSPCHDCAPAQPSFLSRAAVFLLTFLAGAATQAVFYAFQ